MQNKVQKFRNTHIQNHDTMKTRGIHCVKSVRIRSYSGPYFPTFGLNTERYGVSLPIQCEYGKMRTRITPNTDTFHAVIFRTLAYSETKTYSDLSMPRNQKYIQNPDIFRIRVIWRTLSNSVDGALCEKSYWL